MKFADFQIEFRIFSWRPCAVCVCMCVCLRKKGEAPPPINVGALLHPADRYWIFFCFTHLSVPSRLTLLRLCTFWQISKASESPPSHPAPPPRTILTRRHEESLPETFDYLNFYIFDMHVCCNFQYLEFIPEFEWKNTDLCVLWCPDADNNIKYLIRDFVESERFYFCALNLPSTHKIHLKKPRWLHWLIDVGWYADERPRRILSPPLTSQF